MKKISTPNAPEAAGHYSQAIEHNGFVFVSGQLPLDPITRQVVEGGIDDQVRQAMANVRNILLEAGSDLDKIVKVNISVVDGSLWAEVNRVYAEIMGDHKPARAVIPCGELHYGALIEVEAIAVI